jgi:hypothetical protein
VDLWGNRLHSFCIGLPGSPDLKAGAEVAAFLGTDHHELFFTVQVRAVGWGRVLWCCGVVWCGVVWCGVVWCGVWCVVCGVWCVVCCVV